MAPAKRTRSKTDSKPAADYDVLIVGAGQAGIPLAQALAGKGRRVAIVERRHLGGSCINFGCTPTKAVIASAKVAWLARRASEYGLSIPEVSVDFPAVMARARRMVAESRASLARGLENRPGLRLLRGHARLDGRAAGAFRVRVGEETVTARRVVLDTGTRSLLPPIDGLDTIDFFHADNWIDRDALPESLAVVGGGYTGLELAQFYRRMGSRVTVVEGGGQIAGKEDPEVARELQRLLEAEGIDVRLNASVSSVRKATGSGGAVLTLREGSGRTSELAASAVLVATGRRPNTDDLGLETVGAKMDEKGFLKCDKRLATSVRGIWAAGDIRGGPMFTHTAWDDHRVLVSQLAGDRSRTTDRIVPYAIYTDPQLGRVGMTEAEARRGGRRVRVGRYAMKSNGKAREIGETNGFIQVVVDARTEKILGAAVLAVEGAEIVHLYVDVMNAGGRARAIRNALHIHPTLAEAAQSAVEAALSGPP